MKFKTYSQALTLAEELGSGIINLGLAPDICEYKNLKYLSILLKKIYIYF